MNAQQLSRRHVISSRRLHWPVPGWFGEGLAASGSDTRTKAIIIYFSRTGTNQKGSPKLLPPQPVQISSSSR